MDVQKFVANAENGKWAEMGTITLEKGVYDISALFNFAANTTGVRAGYLMPNVIWRGHLIYEIVNATTGSNRTYINLKGVIEITETTTIYVRALQSSGSTMEVVADVDILKFS